MNFSSSKITEFGNFFVSCHSQQTRQQKHNNSHALIKYSIRNENELYIALFLKVYREPVH